MNQSELLAIEFVIRIMRELYGYDFKGYSRGSLIRRLHHHQKKKQMASIAEMIPYLLTDPHFFDELLSDLSITVTEMFRNPHFYKEFEEHVIPKLKTYPYIKIWHAGCATGEEVYSMAVLLADNQYLDRAQLYATDFNPYALNVAKKGIYPVSKLEKYRANYKQFNSDGSLDDYFTEKYEAVKIKQLLQDRIAFSQHNLASDQSFGQMEVIVCRNVLIYFNDELRERTLKLFSESLVPYGFICLGDKESITLEGFKEISPQSSIYQKVSE